MIKPSALTALLLISFILPGCAKSGVYKFNCLSMGTTIEVTICLEGINIATAKSAVNELKSRIEHINDMLSIFDEKSAVSLINNDASKKTCKLDTDLYLLMKKCKEYYALTGGAFDITIGPLVEAWGFGSTDAKNGQPGDISGILNYTGMDKIAFNDAAGTVSFADPRMRIDFGGIAKGHAVDEVVKILKHRGVRSAIINMGGDLYCIGGNAKGAKWLIGIRNPDDKKSMIAVLRLKDKAAATSGSYENFYIYGGNEYSHIIDPKTGESVRNDLKSVTVVADDCMTADALATAVFVLGEDETMRLINKLQGIDAFLIVQEADGARISMSANMKEYISEK